MQSATWWAASPQLTQYGHVFLYGERVESHAGTPVLHPTVTAEEFFHFSLSYIITQSQNLKET